LINNSGFVGVASTSPWRTFSVTGTVALNGLTSSATGNAVCITASKDITDAGGGTCTPSSERFKTNIQTLPTGSALDQLSRMRVVSFDYKDGSYSTEESPASVGLIAEEVEKINPVLVDYGYDGKPLTLHFERLTGLSIQAIQEQQQQIAALASTTVSLDVTTASLERSISTTLASSSQSTWTLSAALDTTNDIRNLNHSLSLSHNHNRSHHQLAKKIPGRRIMKVTTTATPMALLAAGTKGLTMAGSVATRKVTTLVF
jgi:hypothetical protein